MSIGPPQSILTANAGDGSIHVCWDLPLVGTAAGYNVYASDTEGGTFTQMNSEDIAGQSYRLRNMPEGVTVYVKMTSIDAAGSESALSALANKGTLQKVTGTLKATGVIGDTIPAGIMFAALVGNEVVGFYTDDETVITGGY